MATLTKTFTETDTSLPRKSWTIALTGTNQIVSGNFTLTTPTATAKTTLVSSVSGYTPQNIGGGFIDMRFNVGGSLRFQRGYYEDATFVPGTTYTMSAENQSLYITLSNVFNANNKTDITVNVIAYSDAYDIGFSSAVYQPSLGYYYRNDYSNENTYTWGTIATLTLNAPPQVTLGTVTYNMPHYTGLGEYSVPITQAKALYGGDVTSIKLTIGADSVVQNYSTSTVSNQTISLTPSQAGTFTPTIIVTDSRGQTKTIALSQITVNPYNVPSTSFDVYRTNDIGIKNDEGHYALIQSTITYTDAIATLTEPSIQIDGVDLSNLTDASVTWYTTWSNTSGVLNVISDWTTLLPQNHMVTIYGLIDWDYDTTGNFAEDTSYQITLVANDSFNGHSTPIIQTMSTAYYTIDFQAGGKEIAFGAPANDDLTNVNGKDYSEIGLFKCEMGTNFNDMTQTELDALVSSVIGGNSQYDSGWINITPVSPFKAHSASSVNAYRRVGKVVTVIGEVQPTETLPADTTPRTIYTLPEGFRPIYNTSALMYGSSGYSWNLLIYPGGQVTCSRHRNGGTYVALESWMWLPFYATFIVAD